MAANSASLSLIWSAIYWPMTVPFLLNSLATAGVKVGFSFYVFGIFKDIFWRKYNNLKLFSWRKIFPWNHATFWLLITFSSPNNFREHQIGSGGVSVRSQQGTAAQTSVQQSTTHSQPMRSLTTGKKSVIFIPSAYIKQILKTKKNYKTFNGSGFMINYSLWFSHFTYLWTILSHITHYFSPKPWGPKGQ